MPYHCKGPSTNAVSHKSKREGYKQYDECRVYKGKETVTEKEEEVKTPAPLKKTSDDNQVSPSERRRLEREKREREKEDKEAEKERQREEKWAEWDRQREEEQAEWDRQRREEKSEKGRAWIDAREKQENETRIYFEKKKQLEDTHKKYNSSLVGSFEDTFNKFAHVQAHGEAHYNAVMQADIEKFALYLENKNHQMKVMHERKLKKEKEEKEKQKEAQEEARKKWQEEEEQKRLEAEKAEAEIEENFAKYRLQRRIKFPVFILSFVISVCYRNSIYNIISMQDKLKRWPPLGVLVLLLIVYYKMLTGLLNAAYAAIKEGIKGGYKASKINNFIVYGITALLVTAIFFVLYFVFMHIVFKVW